MSLETDLMCVHRGGDDDNSMYSCIGSVESDGSLNWGGDYRVGLGNQSMGASEDGPVIVKFKNRLICVYREAGTWSLYYTVWIPSSRWWSPPIGLPLPGGSSSAPALCVFNINNVDTLFCVYQLGGSERLAFTTCTDFNIPTGDQAPQLPYRLNWKDPAVFEGGNTMLCGATLTVFNGNLYCVHRGNKGDDFVYYCKWNGSNWTADSQMPRGGTARSDDPRPTIDLRSSCRPAAIEHSGELLCVYQGADNKITTGRFVIDQYSHELVAASDFRRTNESPYQTADGPSLVITNNKVYCVYPSLDRQMIRWCLWDDQNKVWSRETGLNGNRSRTQLGVCVGGTTM
jgi:hypothetical protein